MKDTSWQQVSGWYNQSVGDQGHYYHQHVVIPGALKLLNLDGEDSLLDLGSGQGVLARAIPKVKKYLGLDLSADLVAEAQKHNNRGGFDFKVQDITSQFDLQQSFTHAAIILALQNVANYQQVFQNATKHLQPGGKFLIVINHPHFRIPKQSDWGIDESNNQQYRKVYRYLSPIEVPITMNPGETGVKPKMTWSYHNSLADYSAALSKSGFGILKIEEWVSDKQSEGAAAKMENKARAEIPLFMAILAVKM